MASGKLALKKPVETERLLGRPGPGLHSCVCVGAGLGPHDPQGMFH